MKVLIIYDLIPEEQLRVVVEMSNKEYDFFSKAHNIYINADDDKAGIESSNVISQALTTNEEYRQYCDTDKQREYFGKWVSDLDVTDISGVEKIICSGFIM